MRQGNRLVLIAGMVLILPCMVIIILPDSIGPVQIKITLLILNSAVFAGIFLMIRKKTGTISDSMNTVYKELSDGNLESFIKKAKEIYNDDNNVFISFLVKLKKIVSKNKLYYGNIIQMLKHLQESIDEVIKSNNQISEAAKTIALGAEEQAGDSTDCLVAAETMSNKIGKLSNTTENLVKETSKARGIGEAGVLTFKKLIESLNNYNDIMFRLIERIKELSDEAENIKSITNAISSVASQTNLLSLNASIEAARAGEAGKGFAVVAGEIRKLSEQTQNSSHDIGAVVSRVIEELNQISSMVDESRGIFSKQEQSVAEAENTFNSINSFIEGLINFNSIFLDEFNEIFNLRNTLVDSIGSIAAVAEESAATTEEMASLSMIQTNSSDSLSDMVENLISSMKNLSDITEEFDVEADTAPKKKIGVIYNSSDPFFDLVSVTANVAAKRYGFEIEIVKPKSFDPREQVKAIDRFINEGVVGIAISPISDNIVSPAINKAVESGIKVVCINNDAPGSKRLGSMETNSVEGGRIAGSTTVRVLGGKGKVIMTDFEGTYDANRGKGFSDIVTDYPDIEVIRLKLPSNALNAAEVNAEEYLENIIKSNPEFDLLYCINLSWGTAAAKYFEKTGLKQKKKLVTFDASEEIIWYIKKGVVTAAVAQRPFVWGERLVKWINDSINGKPVPNYEDTGVYEINKNNYAIFGIHFTNES